MKCFYVVFVFMGLFVVLLIVVYVFVKLLCVVVFVLVFGVLCLCVDICMDDVVKFGVVQQFYCDGVVCVVVVVGGFCVVLCIVFCVMCVCVDVFGFGMCVVLMFGDFGIVIVLCGWQIYFFVYELIYYCQVEVLGNLVVVIKLCWLIEGMVYLFSDDLCYLFV